MTDAATSEPLLDAAAARRGDAAAVAAGDTPAGLMRRAAGHLARGVRELAGRGYGLEVVIVAGKGDNGGDGWAAAPLLADAGARVRVVAVDGVDVAASEATTAFRAAWRSAGGTVTEGTGGLDELLARCDVAVDGVLGTGVRGAPRGPAAEAIRALARAAERGTPVVACDVPSGVSADDGSTPGDAVRADVTVTFGARKRGLVLHPGAVHAGRVVVGGLGPGYDPGPTDWSVLTAAGARPPRLAPDADKRARGVVLVVAGARGTSGAAALAGTAAVRAGAGLVTLAVPDAVRAEVAARTDTGVMVRGLTSGGDGELAAAAVADLPDLAGYDAVVAGPGLGHGDGVAAVVDHLRRRGSRVVLDADALNVHRQRSDHLADHVGPLVVTPHERELARIGGGDDGPDAWAHRVERVPELARRLDATVVAKGPGTLVAAPDGRVWVCPVGGPTLGSGGTGDVLAGVVAAAVAPAADVPLAVARAVWWHAVAGVRAGADRADRGSATDLLVSLPGALGDPDPRSRGPLDRGSRR